ncbi:MAG: gliding motility protein GldN [Bacteroidota bacterium]
MKSLVCTIICALFVTISSFAQPVNDIVIPKILQQKSVLPYPPIQERDIMWKKYVWRIIDVREKMNLHFTYPKAPFFEIMTKAAQKGELNLYSPEDEQFTYNLSETELHEMLFEQDTVEVIDENFNVEYVPVENNLNYESVKRFRIKEVWYFDSHYSVLKVRILGIAPLIEVENENGDFAYERPLFWAAYNELRPILAKEQVFNPRNDATHTSWEDLMEMRYFASTIIKASNVYDRKIEDYLTGVDALLEAQKIEQEIFNFEHDQWAW